MGANYEVKAKANDDVTLELQFASKKVAIDIRDQLNAAGLEATAKMTKELD